MAEFGKREVYFNSPRPRNIRCYTRAHPMDCTLLIPHLLPPMAQAEALWRTVDAPLLKIFLARAKMTRSAETSSEEWLCSAFDIARHQDFPLAPILAADDALNAASGYWLCATPVHLETRRNALVLTDPDSLDITPEESTALAATLAAHLRDEGIHLHAPRPDNWFLQCEAIASITTTNLGTTVGRDVRTFLPGGQHSPRWHRILTEMQMLLHSHAINAAREARGQLPINSVWLWGGGTLPARSVAPFTRAWSDDATVRALAHHSGCPVKPLPARIMPEIWTSGSSLLSFETLALQLRQGDVQAWSNAAVTLSRDWLIPLIASLKARRLQSLTVVTIDDAGTRTFTARPYDLRKFWRHNKYLQ